MTNIGFGSVQTCAHPLHLFSLGLTHVVGAIGHEDADTEEEIPF